MLFVHRVGVVMPALVVPAFGRVLVTTTIGPIFWIGLQLRGIMLNLRGCVFSVTVWTTRHTSSLRPSVVAGSTQIDRRANRGGLEQQERRTRR